MKQLYRQKYIVETTYKTKLGVETIKYIGYWNNLKYGEGKDSFFESKEWSKLLYSQNYCEPEFRGYKNRKGLYLDVDYSNKYGDRCQKRIYMQDFVSVKVYFKTMNIQPNEIKMSQLIKELPVDQFIEYMVDNGLRIEGLV